MSSQSSEPILSPGPGDEQSVASIASSLLQRLKGDDGRSWQELHFLYSPIIQHWLHRAGLQPSDAADLEQDVFKSVWRNIARFQRTGEGATFRGWLWTITQNKIRDFHRANTQQDRGEGGTNALERIRNVPAGAEQETTACPPQDQLENRELILRAVQLVKNDVQEQTWQAFWLTAVEGLTAAEAGERLQLKIGSVYTARSRVLARLREVLGNDAETLLKRR